MSKTIRVWEILIDGPADGPAGPAGDGTFVRRFAGKTGERDAKALADVSTCYGKPVAVSVYDAPRRLAQRWGFA